MVNCEEAARITQYLDLKAPAKQADIAFAFGSARSAPTHIAAKLFLEGIVDYIVLTGGRNRQSGEIEADKHLPILRQKEIPPERIILENRSTNTMENVCFARALIEKRLNMNHIYVMKEWYNIPLYLEKGHLSDVQQKNGAYV